MILANSCNIHKQSTSAKSFVIVVKTLPFSRKTECLAGKSGKTNIELRYIFFIYFCYISGNLKVIVKIGFVCFLCIFIPFTYKNSTDFIPECSVKSKANAADSRK